MINKRKLSVDIDKNIFNKLGGNTDTISSIISDMTYAFIGLAFYPDSAQDICEFAKQQSYSYRMYERSEDSEAFLEACNKIQQLYSLKEKVIPSTKKSLLTIKKQTICFTDRDFAYLESFCGLWKLKKGVVVNAFIMTIFNMPEPLKVAYATHFRTLHKIEQSRFDGLPPYLADECQRRIRMYSKASEILDNQHLKYILSQQESNMNILTVKNGKCIFPKDWIVLDNLCNIFGDIEQCEYAHVIECRNGTKYGVPHFIFFSNFPTNAIHSEEESIIFEAATKKQANIPMIRAKEIDVSGVTLDGRDKITGEQRFTFQEWREAPSFGFFPIVKYKDPLYWNSMDPGYEPPYGAMIITENQISSILD